MTEPVRLKNAVTDKDHLWGGPEAPITLVEYGNFECLDCGRTFTVIKELQKMLGDNLRFVYRHFPTVRTHPHAMRAAEAAEAAAAQGKFWEMHDQLFTHQRALEDHSLSRYAKRIGLDTQKFTRELTEHTFLNQIEADYQRALLDEHITGTPTLYFNEVRYTGASDLPGFLVAVKEADPEGRIKLRRGRGVRALFNGLLHRGKD